MSEKEHVLKILSRAIIRETAAFNYYYKQGEGEDLPPGVKGLLLRLAEEERIHRRLLMNEYVAIDKGWNEKWDRDKGKVLTYELPAEPVFIKREASRGLEITAVSLPSVIVGGDNILTTVIRGKANADVGTFMALYDVMGHNMETTEINAFANRILGEYIDENCTHRLDLGAMGPKKIIERLNRIMAERFEGEGVFLTIMAVMFDTASSNMIYTIAGHEPPFLVTGDRHIESLLKTQLIVGIDPEFIYHQTAVPFEKGSMLCVVSDGII